jgi:glycine cleavage system H protein
MATARGCAVPDDRLYEPENMLWYRRRADGLVEVGITQVAVAMARKVIAITPKRAGRPIEAGQAVAVVESGKLVASARTPFAAYVVDSNEDLLDRPNQVNLDPYGTWVVVLRFDDWESVRARLLSHEAAAAAFEARMAEENFKGCEGP